MSQSGIYAPGSGGGGNVLTLTGNTGGAVSPTGGDIAIVGTGGVLVTGNPATHTLTITAATGNLIFDTDGTAATPVADTIHINGDGTNISTNGVGDVVTVSLANSPNVSGSMTVGTTLTVSGLGLGVVQSSAAGLFSSSNGTNGELLIGNTGVAPAWTTLTAGGGISIINSAGSITIESVGGGFAWTVITAATQNLANNNGYIANRGGGVTFTLPLAAAVGDTIKITGMNAGGFVVDQNAGQTIYFGVAQTTTGTMGSLSSSSTRDSLEMVCIIPSTSWNVVNAVGNLVLA